MIAASQQRYGNVRAGIEAAIHAELVPPVEAPSEASKPKHPPLQTSLPVQNSSSPVQKPPAFYTPRPRTDTPRPPTVSPVVNVQAPPREPVSSKPRFVEPSPRVERHVPAQRSPEDLKSILRNIADKTKKEESKVQTLKPSPLTDALRDVMKTAQTSTPAPVSTPISIQPRTQTPSVSAPPQQKIIPPVTPPQVTPAEQPLTSKPPYEVSEELLRKILRGDDV